MNTKEHYLLSEVAREIAVPGYKIAYAITSGYVPDAKFWAGHRRVFSKAEVEHLRQYFRTRRRRNAKEVAK